MHLIHSGNGTTRRTRSPQQPSSDALFDVLASLVGRHRPASGARPDDDSDPQFRELRERGARAHLDMLRKSDDGSMAILDPSGLVVCWYARRGDFERTGAPVVNRHVSQFYVASDVADQLPQRHLETAAAHGHSSRDGWRISGAGRRFWGVTHIRAIADHEGTIEGFLHVIRPSCGSREDVRVAVPRPWVGATARSLVAPEYVTACAAA